MHDQSIDDEAFDACVLNVYNEEKNVLVLSLIFDLDLIEDEYIYEASDIVYHCLLDLIYDRDDFEYVSDRSWFRVCQIDAIKIMSLSMNNMKGSQWTWLFNKIDIEKPAGWELVFDHYNENTRTFSNEGQNTPALFYIFDLEQRWDKDNDIWLWACDAGLPYGDDQYIVAQDMADIVEVNVCAPLGMIFCGHLLRTKNSEEPYGYAIVDLHGTKWSSFEWYCCTNKKEYDKFVKYLRRHDLTKTDNAWKIFIPSTI